MMNSPRLLILGCGYLGARIAAQAVQKGCLVDILTRNPEAAFQLKSTGVHQAEVAYLQNQQWHQKFQADNYRAVYITVGSSESTPEGYRESYIDGMRSVMQWSSNYTGKLLFTGSISVYGEANGDWVDETVPPNPRNWRGEMLLESEQLLATHPGANKTVFRLGGIYGPDRNRFLINVPDEGSQSPAYRDSFLNLIHVEDAASALLSAGLHAAEDALAPLYNLTDNHPFTRGQLQQYVSDHYPHLVQSNASIRRRGISANRRINSSLVQSHLRWVPSYRSVFDAFRDLV